MQPEPNNSVTPPLARRYSFWWLLTGAWCTLALFMAYQLVLTTRATADPIPWYDAIPFELSYCLQWLAFARVTLLLARYFPLGSKKFYIGIVAHLMLGMLLSSLTMGGRTVLSWILIHHFQTPLTIQKITSNMKDALDYGMLSYLVNMLFCYSYEFYNQVRERELRALNLEAELSRAQLLALKMQLHPHFFFNTLNVISVLIRKHENDLAVDMIARLSKFLRYTLDKTSTQEVTLREELDAIDLYLEIQKVRFQDQLILKRTFSPDSLDSRVPTLILQPLVENAIQHGISRREQGGTLELSAERLNGSVHIRISDDGPGLNGTSAETIKHGIGLQNTISRLEKLYGKDYIFEINARNEGGTTVHIAIPYHIESD